MATDIFKMKNVYSLAACLFLASCGGSGSESTPTQEPPAPVLSNYYVELFTGKTAIDFSKCSPNSEDVSAANYANLSKIAIYKDSIELLESYEKCKDSSSANVVSIKNNIVNRRVLFFSHDVGGLFPINSKYPSGFYKSATSDYFVVGFVAASSDKNFELDPAVVAEYDSNGAWDGYAPGIFHSPKGFVVVGSNAPPQVVDGQGSAARFYAPHDLEVDAKQLMYTVDKGMVRTIDQGYQVKTLQNADLGVGGAVKAIDADRAGGIHVLGRQPDGSYIWVRLADKSKVAFKLRADDGPAALKTIETFTVVGDSLVLARRNYEASTSELFRVSPAGVVENLTGSGRIAWLSTGTAVAPFPQVQHLEYGIDGHLYIVLPQGVLRIKDFK